MEIRLGLLLPREGATIPMARHISRYALAEIGVADESRQDIEVALTEACTNVIKHSGPGDAYEVELSVEDDLCCIRVIDRGPPGTRCRSRAPGR
ncbi:MAG TPA: ATP-binding protein [Acidimicrobiales bacterium]|nr:ATP-binding protein [Acidimicrobiales bacterium]